MHPLAKAKVLYYSSSVIITAATVAFRFGPFVSDCARLNEAGEVKAENSVLIKAKAIFLQTVNKPLMHENVFL